MRSFPLCFAVGAALMTPVSVSAAPCTLGDLHWMAGTWRDTSEPNVSVEERWVEAPNGRLAGSSWRLHSDTPNGVIESLLIEIQNGVPTMMLRHFDATLAHAREDKDSPMVFVSSQCSANLAVFDGTGSQAGEHITYSRVGDKLTFIGDFIHDGKPFRAEESFNLQP